MSLSEDFLVVLSYTHTTKVIHPKMLGKIKILSHPGHGYSSRKELGLTGIGQPTKLQMLLLWFLDFIFCFLRFLKFFLSFFFWCVCTRSTLKNAVNFCSKYNLNQTLYCRLKLLHSESRTVETAEELYKSFLLIC